MGLRWVRTYRGTIQNELSKLFNEEHDPREVAASFAVGVFITSLPTLGLGLLLFAVLVYLFDWVSKVALLASVVVLNPVVKWGVYLLSYWIGTLLLGPAPELAATEPLREAGAAVLLRLLVGNVLVAVAFTIIGYVAVHRLILEFRARNVDLSAEFADTLAD